MANPMALDIIQEPYTPEHFLDTEDRNLWNDAFIKSVTTAGEQNLIKNWSSFCQSRHISRPGDYLFNHAVLSETIMPSIKTIIDTLANRAATLRCQTDNARSTLQDLDNHLSAGTFPREILNAVKMTLKEADETTMSQLKVNTQTTLLQARRASIVQRIEKLNRDRVQLTCNLVTEVSKCLTFADLPNIPNFAVFRHSIYCLYFDYKTKDTVVKFKKKMEADKAAKIAKKEKFEAAKAKSEQESKQAASIADVKKLIKAASSKNGQGASTARPKAENKSTAKKTPRKANKQRQTKKQQQKPKEGKAKKDERSKKRGEGSTRKKQ